METKNNETTPSEAQDAPLSTVVKVPVVGIGASAGGLAAFEAFFSGMPPDTEPGMAFILVQHLAPEHKSILSELLQRYTRMKVFEVTNGMEVQLNCVYIIPPNQDMAFANGALQLLEVSAPRGQRLPIDFLFYSLAKELREHAIGVVLSGTGSDGALGIRAIKKGGGMAIAQLPSSAEFDGMPRSAVATGVVDCELPAAEMAAYLISYVGRAFIRAPQPEAIPNAESSLHKIFALLRAQTGHDFSLYKPSTIQRRIERRMAVHQIEALDGYVRYLQQTPVEVEALFRDVLIGVTNFFRDEEAFRALEEQIIPKLFKDKGPGASLRVWSAGCSTGEEAYSIAILLRERMDALKQSYKVQVFATDIDERAITTARAGFYPASIADEVSPERLARFFIAEAGGGYRVNKNIRDMIIFSEQDVIKDPPFSKLDLISCRNLLIYMGSELQKKLIPLFHYVLNPSGVLFLGTSETIGDFGALFSPLDNKAKLYRRKEVFQVAQRALGRFLIPTRAPEIRHEAPGASSRAKLSLRELTERALLAHSAMSGALVNPQGDILYLHGRTGMYLEPAQGEASVNIVKMAREGLRRELTTALHKSSINREIVRVSNLQVKTNGHFVTTSLTVRPVETGATNTHEPLLFLVIMEAQASAEPAKPIIEETLEPLAEPRAETNNELNTHNNATIASLNDELRANKEYLQAANEELETSNEELKSSNEEMQSINEELQSSNEELETSKEELQSINEELATVNAELQAKVTDLSRASNDLNNLLAGTGIGTIFVDHQLRISRFTPAATKIVNLIPGDIGRPISHIVSNLLGYERLVEDAQSVLDTLIPKEANVQTKEGSWYTMRILPYRTLDNIIEGAVLTFADITEVVQAREALNRTTGMVRLAVVVRDSHDAIIVQSLEGQILAWNPGATRIYGWSEAEAQVLDIRDIIPPRLREAEIAKVKQLSQSEILEPYYTQRLTKSGEEINISVTSTALINSEGQIYAISTTERAREPRRGAP